MRDIKFRGRRKGGTEWLIGDLNHIDGKAFIFPRTEDTPLNSPDWFEIDPETVGQFIGLKDKIGNEIYEGDIVRTFRGGLYMCDFRENGCFEFKSIDTGDYSLFVELHEPNIIGNINTNPEIIK